MKSLTKSKSKKQPLSKKRRPENACLHPQDHLKSQSSAISNNLALSTEMLVSLSETERFKLDFLISSYQELITSFKHQRKNFIENMKSQFQTHLFYYTQIITLAKTYEQNTKIFLRTKLQDLSNTFQLKISLLQTKLKNTQKINFQNHSYDSFFSQNKIKIKKSHSQKLLQVGKTSSYEEGIDFDEQLKQIYNQKSFRIDLNFVPKKNVQQSLQSIKIALIKNWETKESQSVSFSSVSNPEKSEATFQGFCFESESDERIGSLDKNQTKMNNKNFGKYAYVSNETNASSKQRFGSGSGSTVSTFQLKKKKCAQQDISYFQNE